MTWTQKLINAKKTPVTNVNAHHISKHWGYKNWLYHVLNVNCNMQEYRPPIQPWWLSSLEFPVIILVICKRWFESRLGMCYKVKILTKKELWTRCRRSWMCGNNHSPPTTPTNTSLCYKTGSPTQLPIRPSQTKTTVKVNTDACQMTEI